MAVRVAVIDNYDSFTYNLVQYLWELGAEVDVFRNDATDVPKLRAGRYDRVLLSPGPGAPKDAGICLDVVREMAGEVPILGVCLGHQVISEAFGARVIRAPRLMHGRTSSVLHDGRGCFSGFPSPFTATRYHSLIVEEPIPEVLERCAWTQDGELMGVRHRHHPVAGVQFHPESFLTEHGHALLGSFLAHGGERGQR